MAEKALLPKLWWGKVNKVDKDRKPTWEHQGLARDWAGRCRLGRWTKTWWGSHCLRKLLVGRFTDLRKALKWSSSSCWSITRAHLPDQVGYSTRYSTSQDKDQNYVSPGYALYAPGELSRMNTEERSAQMADKSLVYDPKSSVQCCR